MEISVVVITFIVGFLFGMVMHKLCYKRNSAGFLIIDETDPDGPYMFLELAQDVNTIHNSDDIVLGVKVRHPFSQE